jgi:hypothetical protein
MVVNSPICFHTLTSFKIAMQLLSLSSTGIAN